MTLVQKLTAALVAAMCAILMLNGIARVRREAALFESQATREHRSVARALRSSVLAVFRTEGEAAALALVDDATRSHGRITFRWVWLDTSPPLHTSLPLGEEPVTVIDGDERFTYVAMTTPGGRRGAIELAESLAAKREYVRKTIVEAGVTTLALVLACAFIALAASNLLVGRPIRALVEKARRVGEGDFSGPLAIRGRDELAVLAREMNATSDRLVAAREELRHAERLSTLGMLASGIAHELGTPVNVIAGHADMIATREVEGEQAIESARVITQAAQKVASTVRQFLDYARRREPQRAEYDLYRITAQSTTLLQPLAHKKNVRLRVEDGEQVKAHVDAGQIQQAVTNLVVNAIHAVRSGGHVDVSCGRDRDRVFIRVRDDGPGIPDKALPKIFDPFFTTKPPSEGTGLGLSVVQGIVADHGGSIEVVNDGGAIFTIFLPRDGSRRARPDR
jgi:signal transduction histidine kinase